MLFLFNVILLNTDSPNSNKEVYNENLPFSINENLDNDIHDFIAFIRPSLNQKK